MSRTRPARPLLPPLRRPALVLALATLAALSGANQAAPGAMADPTRPPPGMASDATAPAHSGNSAGNNAGNGSGNGLGTGNPGGTRLPRAAVADVNSPPAASRAGTARPAAEPLPVLQAVQVNARGPASAMLDGRLVRTGDAVGTRRVISIDVEGVVLRGGGVTERLWLLSGAPKQPVGSIVVHRAARYTADAASAATAVATPVSPLSPSSPASPADAAGTTPPGPVLTAGQRTSP